MPVWPATVLQLLVVACAPGGDSELPVVALGRYVEIASDRDEPVCGGTADYMDRVLDAAFSVMDEAAPDHRFVRFEWLELDEDDPVIGGGLTSSTEDGVLIRSDVDLVHEHELVHAAQRAVWPLSNSFLHEGHAVLLDGKRLYLDAYHWPKSASLDDLLEARDIRGDYDLAWFIVSQIVLDHGFDGLRDFWYAVPRGSTAAEVRAAYQTLFGRPIETLIEPYVVEHPEPIGPTLVERRACDFALCAAPQATAWRGDEWTADGPIGCEDDPDAIGPDQRNFEWGDVWRDYIMPGENTYYYSTFDFPAKASVSLGPCGLNCDHQATGLENSFEGPPNYPGPHFGYWEFPARVEVRAALADLPLEPPRTFRLILTSEPPPD